MIDHPDGIIITISQAMLKERGFKTWLKEFYEAMQGGDWSYWLRLGNKPKCEPLYVYILIGGKIRFRCNFVMYSTGEMTFNNGKSMKAKTWCVVTGPLYKCRVHHIMKGFRGFRYTDRLFT